MNMFPFLGTDVNIYLFALAVRTPPGLWNTGLKKEEPLRILTKGLENGSPGRRKLELCWQNSRPQAQTTATSLALDFFGFNPGK